MTIDQRTVALLDNFTQQTIETITQALAEKDKIIQELKQRLANCTCAEVTRE